MSTTPKDERSAAELLRAYERLAKVRRELIRNGLLNGDAGPKQIIECLRAEIPVDLFT